MLQVVQDGARNAECSTCPCSSWDEKLRPTSMKKNYFLSKIIFSNFIYYYFKVLVLQESPHEGYTLLTASRFILYATWVFLKLVYKFSFSSQFLTKKNPFPGSNVPHIKEGMGGLSQYKSLINWAWCPEQFSNCLLGGRETLKQKYPGQQPFKQV